jgi:hypothetical protein
MSNKRSHIIKALLILPGLLLPACAARQPAPESQAQRTEDASYRVVLVNRTSQLLHYHYQRYLPPQSQRETIPQDPYGTPQMSASLSISLADDELKPGETTVLEVLPSTNISVTYMAAGQERKEEKKLSQPMQLVVAESGIKQEALPDEYRFKLGQ